jgi:dolichol-phosphate mannosyltransferase
MSCPRTPPTVSVVLPTYNERENIVPLIRQLDRCMRWPFEAVVVDDDSPDGTAEVVAALSREIDYVRLVLRKRERGLTGAIQRGIDEAAGDVVVWMDCDLSMPPEKVPELVASVLEEGADTAVGSRYVAGGAAESGGRDNGLVRLQKALTRRMNRLYARLTGAEFHDWTSGFIAIRAPLIKRIRLRGDYGEYFIHLVAELLRRGARVVELPYRCVPREHGESKTARGWLDLARLGARYLRALGAARRTLRATRLRPRAS